MNDLVSYIFRNMDATDKHLIHIYKALVHQNKFNKAATFAPLPGRGGDSGAG